MFVLGEDKNGVLVLSALAKTIKDGVSDEWKQLERDISPFVLGKDYCGINNDANREVVNALFFKSEADALQAEDKMNQMSEKYLQGLKMAKAISKITEEEFAKITAGIWSFE